MKSDSCSLFIEKITCMQKNILIIALLIFSIHLFSQSVSIPQWRGPERDGIYPETGLLQSWPDGGPPLLWSVDGIGKGYSSAVSDGKTIYVTGMNENTDVLFAIDNTGKIIWQKEFGPSWTGSFPETRCTPTVVDGRVYVISGKGNMACFDANDGSTTWSFDAYSKFEGVCGDWGVCESLLISGDRIFYSPGGKKTTMVAIDKNNGETIWMSESLDDMSAYVSPRMIRYGNRDIVVNVMNDNLIGVDAENGTILWKYNYGALFPEEGLKVWPGAPHTNTITPLFKDGRLYITGGYNHVGAMFSLSDDASSISLAWTDTTLDCHHGGVVLVDGNIYGSNWFDNSRGNWCCIGWENGKPHWEHKWFTKGSIIYADGMLYCFEEKNGNLGLVRPDPGKFEMVSSFKIEQGKGPYWSHPAIADGVLYVRHGDILLAYDIKNK